MKKYPIIGAHVSMNAPNQYLIGSVASAVQDGANTFMIYTGPPQSSHRKPTNALNIAQMHVLLKEHNIDPQDLVVHAPYIINLANPVSESTWTFSVDFLKKEMQRCDEIGIEILVLHPGAFTKGTSEAGLAKLIQGLKLVFQADLKTKIALETMSGKGTEVGINFDQLAYVLKQVGAEQRLGICLDTCHMNDAGYNLNQWDDIKAEIQAKIGYEKVLAFHLNDSKNPIGAHKDRHENIGYGTIGFDNLVKILWDEDFKEIPKILETPYLGDQSPYKAEIADLLNKQWSDPFKNSK
ncbi:deoxyribonuclease IV [Williamsoniiplasma lucivorax]|nr:deoxyribonuclease IV [Williamsoniiplasma lucivorax]